MKRLTALSVLIMLALAAPAGANPSAVAGPDSPPLSMVATTGTIPVDLRIVYPDADLSHYTATIAVTIVPNWQVPPLESEPLNPVAGDPGHYTATLTGNKAGGRWASPHGQYFWHVELHPVLAPPPPGCSHSVPVPLQSGAGTILCSQVVPSFPTDRFHLVETTPHPLRMVTALNARHARVVARGAATAIGWKKTAPVTCVAPYVPSAFACTFTWHKDGRAVVRRLVVSQDPTGAISVKR